jgi:3-methyladenine DNA glycosylase AlkD
MGTHACLEGTRKLTQTTRFSNALARDSDDARLVDLAFESIDKFKGDREILVTKVVSWLLRDLIKHHHREVEAYLRENEADLPSVAVRETRRKLLTGRK